MRKILLYIFVFVLGQEAIAQNLVRNPSFEEYINCPYDYTHVKDSVKELLPFWYVANNVVGMRFLEYQKILQGKWKRKQEMHMLELFLK